MHRASLSHAPSLQTGAAAGKEEMHSRAPQLTLDRMQSRSSPRREALEEMMPVAMAVVAQQAPPQDPES